MLLWPGSRAQAPSSCGARGAHTLAACQVARRAAPFEAARRGKRLRASVHLRCGCNAVLYGRRRRRRRRRKGGAAGWLGAWAARAPPRSGGLRERRGTRGARCHVGVAAAAQRRPRCGLIGCTTPPRSYNSAEPGRAAKQSRLLASCPRQRAPQQPRSGAKDLKSQAVTVSAWRAAICGTRRGAGAAAGVQQLRCSSPSPSPSPPPPPPPPRRARGGPT